MPLFKIVDNNLIRIKSNPFSLEKEIQILTENGLEELFNLELICSEFSLKNFRIDSLAFDNETLVGTCSVNKLTRRQRHVGEFGIMLNKEYRSIGLGSQISKIIIEQAFSDLEINMIILTSFKRNERALGLYKNLGFKQYGYLEKALYYKGEYLDEVFMYLMKDEYRNHETE